MKFGTMVVIGPPNVGKSTLVNTLVQQKVAIVSDKPQTTRTRVLGVVHLPHTQLALVDTPGLHRPWHRLNKRMIQTALETLAGADVVSVMVDGRSLPGSGEELVLDQVATELSSRPNLPIFLLVNKIDVINKIKVLPVIEAYHQRRPWTEIIPISAKTGLNLDRLMDLAVACLPEGEGGYEESYVTDQTMRQLASEIIREKVLEQTRAELPYAVAVNVEQFEEEGRLARIGASVFVEKEGQKGILIGKGGARLKAIGTAARREMEHMFDMKVFLELWVKVRATWRDDERLLGELGY